MNERTLKALRGSIRKWERIATGHAVDQGSFNCPLCNLFAEEKPHCSGCPVMIRTGRSSCLRTPYERFGSIADRENTELAPWTRDHPIAVAGPRAQQAAIDEYNFLVSLLPPGTKP